MKSLLAELNMRYFNSANRYKRINSSIGSQWGTKDTGRAQNLEDELRKVLEGPPKIDEEQQKNIKMNVIFAEDLEIIK